MLVKLWRSNSGAGNNLVFNSFIVTIWRGSGRREEQTRGMTGRERQGTRCWIAREGSS